MAIDVNSIKGTANVIQLNGVNFQNNLGKRLRFEKIDFSQYDEFPNAAANAMLNWMKTSRTKQDYFSDETIFSPTGGLCWMQGLSCYDYVADISAKVTNGAKYLYMIENKFALASEYDDDGDDAIQLYHSGASFINSSSKTNLVRQNDAYELISKIAMDADTAYQKSFDSFIVESVYDLEKCLNYGYDKASFAYIKDVEAYHVVNNVRFDASYVNTAISGLIGYWIYEQ